MGSPKFCIHNVNEKRGAADCRRAPCSFIVQFAVKGACRRLRAARMVITCRCRADTPPRRVAGYYAPKAAGIISAQGVRPPTLIPIPFRGFGPDRHLLNNLTRYARLSIDTRARPFRPFAGPRGGTFLWPCD